jgi:hypothetical protein
MLLSCRSLMRDKHSILPIDASRLDHPRFAAGKGPRNSIPDLPFQWIVIDVQVRGSNGRSEKEIESPSDCQESDNQEGDSARAQSRGGAQGRSGADASRQGWRGFAARETRRGQISGEAGQISGEAGEVGPLEICGGQVARQVVRGEITCQAGKARNDRQCAKGRAQDDPQRNETGRQIVRHASRYAASGRRSYRRRQRHEARHSQRPLPLALGQSAAIAAAWIAAKQLICSSRSHDGCAASESRRSAALRAP